MDKEEGNKLIAEFMGYIPYKPLRKGIFGEREMVWYYKEKTFWSALFYINYFKYHSSWDWLMPVVEKISEVCKLDKHKLYTKFYNGGREELLIFRFGIEETWDLCIEFIQWYNAQKQ